MSQNETPLDAIKLKEGIDSFNAPRQEGDMDLIAIVRQVLIDALSQKGRQLTGFDSNYLIAQALKAQPHIQRWQLNRYWTIQLACAPSSTLHIRQFLINDGTEEDWLRLFTQKVLPFVVDNNLPVDL